MKQTDRVLALLQRRGAQGITPIDFLLPGVADGGKPITRLAARIKDLRDAGHRIDSGVAGGVAVYRLASAASSGPEAQQSAHTPAAAPTGVSPHIAPRPAPASGPDEAHEAPSAHPAGPTATPLALTDACPSGEQTLFDLTFDECCPPRSHYQDAA